MNQNIMTIRCPRPRLLQHISQLAIGRNAVVGSGKRDNRQAFLSIHRKQISPRLLPALFYFRQENDCGDVGGFQILQERSPWVIQPEWQGAAVNLASKIERVYGE